MRVLVFILFLVMSGLGFAQSGITYTKIRNNLAVIVGSDTLKIYKSGTTWYLKPVNQLVLEDVDSVKFTDATSISSATDSVYVKFVNSGWVEGWKTIGQDTLKIDTTGSVAPVDTAFVRTVGDNMYGTFYLNGVEVRANGSFGLGAGVAIGGATTTIRSVAIGDSALGRSTAGYNNAIGTNALGYNTTGAYNQAFGVNTLLANTTGLNNVAMGHYSLAENTTGTSNIGIVYWAALGQRQGSFNIAIGDQALRYDTGGSYNVAIGYKAQFGALLANSTGNTAVGTQSLYTNSTGDYNVAIGYRALYNNTYGGNVAIGHAAGFSANDSNMLYIDNSDTTAALITGDFDENSVTINGKLCVSEAIHLFAFFGDSTVAISYALADTWYQVTNATDSLWRYQEKDGFTVSNDTITITDAGDYDLTCGIKWEGNNGTSYDFRFYNVTQTTGIPIGQGGTGAGAGNRQGTTVGAYATFSAGDKVIIQSRNFSTNDYTLENSFIKIYKVHE